MIRLIQVILSLRQCSTITSLFHLFLLLYLQFSKPRQYAPLTMHERVGMYVRGFDVSDIAKRVTRNRAHCTIGAGKMRKVNVFLVEREANDGVRYNTFLIHCLRFLQRSSFKYTPHADLLSLTRDKLVVYTYLYNFIIFDL
jgi:hypothetical protein